VPKAGIEGGAHPAYLNARGFNLLDLYLALRKA